MLPHHVLRTAVCLIVISGLATVVFGSSSTDSTLIPFRSLEKWGYINTHGRVVIKAQFDEADRFSEDLARVQVGSKSGYIDSSGRFVIEPIYTFAFSFSEGLAVVGKDMSSPWFYIDRTGQTIIEPRNAIWIGPFNDGLAKFSRNIGGNSLNTYDARDGFINKQGQIVIDPKFTNAGNFAEGLAVVADDKPNKNTQAYFNKKAFIDVNGNIVTPFFDRAENFSDGLALVTINGLDGYVDKNGILVIRPNFDFASDFVNGFAVYGCEEDKFGFINKKGEKAVPCIYKDTGDFVNGLAPVKTSSNKWGFINSKGKLVIKAQFDWADSFFNGLAEVRIRRGDWLYSGFINPKGIYVFTPVRIEKEDG